MDTIKTKTLDNGKILSLVSRILDQDSVLVYDSPDGTPRQTSNGRMAGSECLYFVYDGNHPIGFCDGEYLHNDYLTKLFDRIQTVSELDRAQKTLEGISLMASNLLE